MSNKILVLFAHPSPHRSEVNLPLMQATADNNDVTVVDLYAEYPGLNINIDREQQRLREHEVLPFLQN